MTLDEEIETFSLFRQYIHIPRIMLEKWFAGLVPFENENASLKGYTVVNIKQWQILPNVLRSLDNCDVFVEFNCEKKA